MKPSISSYQQKYEVIILKIIGGKVKEIVKNSRPSRPGSAPGVNGAPKRPLTNPLKNLKIGKKFIGPEWLQSVAILTEIDMGTVIALLYWGR